MKLDQVCSEGHRPHALLLTYSIDPLFFETVGWRALTAGGADRIVVMADGTQLAEAMAAKPRLRLVGRRWVLTAADVEGTFHPKFIARFGSEDAAVAVLSGNLTSGGWGRNLELGRAWTVGPAHEDGGGWLRELVAAARRWARSRAAREFLDDIARIGWLAAARDVASQARAVVFSDGYRSLFDQTRARWRNRRFVTARMMTGSTDLNGALLERLTEEFGIQTAEVVVEPDCVSFVEQRIRALPCRARVFAPPPERRPLHAKLLHLSGPDGDACAWGSANCSAAAWLVPPARGGNVELVVLDDEPDPKGVEALFKIMEKGKRISGVDVPPPERQPRPRIHELVVRGAVYHARDRTLEVEFNGPNDIAEVEFVLDCADLAESIRVRLALEGEPGTWMGALGDAEAPRHSSLFGHVEARLGRATVASATVWVDQIVDLAKRSSDVDLFRQYQMVSPEARTLKERERILADLWSIADEVLGASDRETSTAARWRQRDDRRDDGPAAILDPAQLVRDIVLRPRGVSAALRWRSRSLPAADLSLFERVFFDPPEDEPAPEHDPDMVDEERDDRAPPPAVRSPVPAAPAQASDRESEIDRESRKKVRQGFDERLRRMQTTEFLAAARPHQLVDGVFVLLAVAYKAWRGGWISAAAAGLMAADVAHTLLCANVARHRGILVAYRAGLADKDAIADWAAAVGKGRLWAALLAMLVVNVPATEPAAVYRSWMLTLTFRRGDLVALAEADALSRLFDRSVVGDLIARAFALSTGVSVATEALAGAVADRFDNLLRRQGGSFDQDRGHLFWSRLDGWFQPKERGFGTMGDAVSLQRAIRNDPRVRELTQAVLDAWKGGLAERKN